MSNTPNASEQAATARKLVRSLDSGILCTMSQELPGYPFGSVTPYALTHEGRVAVYVSGIAQHTHNMNGDSKVCLTVAAQALPDENQQALGRVTVVGDARLVPDSDEDAVKNRYFAFFPEAREYGGTHDFNFFWLEPRRIRYIGGFGKIFWVETEDWAVTSPEWAASEEQIVTHMNEDHGDSLLDIARQLGQEGDAATMVALDTEGFHVRSASGLFYVSFPAPCRTVDEVRAAMVQLARESARS